MKLDRFIEILTDFKKHHPDKEVIFGKGDSVQRLGGSEVGYYDNFEIRVVMIDVLGEERIFIEGCNLAPEDAKEALREWKVKQDMLTGGKDDS